MKRAFRRQEIAEALTLIENRSPKAWALLKKAFSKNSLRKSICLTGPGGVGKSSLIASLIPLAAQTKSIAWIACDPTSAKTGGSLLGDRIRLDGRSLSDNVFVRSMATRSTQAFSQSVRDVEVFLESFFDEIWVETAGSGQTQTEVSSLSALTVLVLQPQTGDDVQWMKAGVQECADLYVIQKADLPGADMMKKTLIEFGAAPHRIFQVSVKEQEGLEELCGALERALKQVAWPSRKLILHDHIARSLFFERELKKLETAYKKRRARLVRSPY